MIIGQELGTEFLTVSDQLLLKQYGVDTASLYSIAGDNLHLQFQLGLLAESIGQQTSNFSFDQLKEYIAHGDYIPLTQREYATLASIRNNTYTDLKKLGSKIFQDVNNVLVDKSLKGQRDFIRKELEQGFLDKATVTETAHKIAEKTGDWSRDFERIVAYNSHTAFEEGKAAMIQRSVGESEDPVVYKSVFEGACSHCVELYLTNGVGSQPRLFKLSELKENGTNIGRKVKEWKATLGSLHPFCRCLLNYLPKGYVWDKDKREFTLTPSKEEVKPKRKPIRIWIAGEEHMI